ncbi:hypothetical protein GCM10020366_04160 [Saccharopolyspora gregorii]|uniref:S-adenosyl-L-methionine-dependent methyltransferase n=1 Tax=Saccharopolyspora gregorii TaxID=33914 RepID=A0ABP6RJ10_9PSEU
MTSTHEQWDIVSGVGMTALAVAAARAIESHRDDRLINDPYAEGLVAAARSPALAEMENSSAEMLETMSGYLGVRTRFFDEYFLRAAAGGVQQAVILASGLDTRAFRLNWPEGLRVFEIDQPKVLQFKDETLDGSARSPAATGGSCRWTCATTGRAPSTPPGSTPRCPPRGSPKDSCPTCPPRRKRSCWPPSTGSPPPAE